ncbi:TetR family transcriptional regulator [Maritalea mobilis]|uniref:TetR family transcriptional regulator n=1 Tax=Maritalea mobilis TaxID=483324 RepID=A0A4R6VIQ1_9HYPH|nr:TetR/AcrR family transcriptional regulator [Maritalea mobilis]TDQ61572.1 TetR family transcriptional regulator [Maritalea mobilis]
MPRPNMSAKRIPQILDAAMLVFSRSGLQSTKLEEVALAAGVSKATIYLYFKSKEDLIFALMKRFFEQNMDVLHHLRQTEGDFRQILMEWIDQTEEVLAENDVFVAIGLEFYSFAGRDAQAKDMVRGFFLEYQQLLTEMIETALLTKGKPTDIAPQIAFGLITQFEGTNLIGSLIKWEPGLYGKMKTNMGLLLDGAGL